MIPVTVSCRSGMDRAVEGLVRRGTRVVESSSLRGDESAK